MQTAVLVYQLIKIIKRKNRYKSSNSPGIFLIKIIFQG